MKILITGGAGFVGSSLAIHFKNKYPKSRVVAFDNLKRRGSEINLSLFRELGVEFIHGDIRNPSDLESLSEAWDIFVECSAEPSVLAGINSSPKYVLETNLLGTINCLELARKHCGLFLFLSTSRVYSIAPLRELSLLENPTRFDLAKSQTVSGVTPLGISEKFPTDSSRSLYGTSKLSSEYLIQDYASTYGLNALINRCGVIAGPGQYGKVDQGVYTLWVARHFFKQTLNYTGFGGKGKQVRDLLHIEDLIALIDKQLESKHKHLGESYNVGGGIECSTSLLELTHLCQEATGNAIAIGSEKDSAPVDIPWYVTDYSKVKAAFDWAPKKTIKNLVLDIRNWLSRNESLLKNSFV